MKKFWFSWFFLNFDTLSENDENDEKVISKTASGGRDQM